MPTRCAERNSRWPMSLVQPRRPNARIVSIADIAFPSAARAASARLRRAETAGLRPPRPIHAGGPCVRPSLVHADGGRPMRVIGCIVVTASRVLTATGEMLNFRSAGTPIVSILPVWPVSADGGIILVRQSLTVLPSLRAVRRRHGRDYAPKRHPGEGQFAASVQTGSAFAAGPLAFGPLVPGAIPAHCTAASVELNLNSRAASVILRRRSRGPAPLGSPGIARPGVSDDRRDSAP